MAVSPLTSLFAITARASDVVVQSLQVANCTAGAACKCGDGLIWSSVSACRCQEGLDTSRTRTNTLRPAPGCQGRGAACQHQHNQAFEPLQYGCLKHKSLAGCWPQGFAGMLSTSPAGAGSIKACRQLRCASAAQLMGQRPLLPQISMGFRQCWRQGCILRCM